VEKIDLEQFKEFWNVEPSCKIQSISSRLCLKLLFSEWHMYLGGGEDTGARVVLGRWTYDKISIEM
jgi:hypothetical protein